MERSKHGVWRVTQVSIAVILAIPSLVILFSLIEPYTENWAHLRETVLFGYIFNSIVLLLGVGLLTTVVGVGTAWVIATYEFPGRNFLKWGLLLPLAMPAYIVAYAYTDLMDVLGPVQTCLRALLNLQVGEYMFPPIRSLGGAIFVMAFVLYPYVYLLARITFSNQSHGLIEMGQSLGLSSGKCFWLIALPNARPAVAAGLSLVLMESLADYGTVEYFNVSVFTTGIFRTWYGLGDLTTAAQLSAMLLLTVLVFLGLENASRRQLRYHNPSIKPAAKRYSPRKGAAIFCCLVVSLPFCIGFVIPGSRLFVLAIQDGFSYFNMDFLRLIWNSFSIAICAAGLCLSLALLLVYSKRLLPGRTSAITLRLAISGYAIPGTVIAIGILIMLSHIDRSINIFLSGGIAALLFAYAVRFFAISVQTLETGLEQIRLSIDESSQILGARFLTRAKSIHFPLLKGSIITACLLVFVDVLKELPATLILRPFNFNTLAVKTFELAGDERLSEASLPALTIVLAGIIPIIIMTNSIDKLGKSN